MRVTGVEINKAIHLWETYRPSLTRLHYLDRLYALRREYERTVLVRLPPPCAPNVLGAEGGPAGQQVTLERATQYLDQLVEFVGKAPRLPPGLGEETTHVSHVVLSGTETRADLPGAEVLCIQPSYVLTDEEQRSW